jgi:hypothetical protein
MKKVFNFYKKIEKVYADHPIAAMAVTYFLTVAVSSSIFPKQVWPLVTGDHQIKGYWLIIGAFICFVAPSLYYVRLLNKRHSFKQSIIDRLETIDIKLHHDNLITTSHQLKCYPNSVLECYESYIFVLGMLEAKYGNEFKSFPTRLAPIVKGKDWIPFDEVTALHTDVKAILKRLRERPT